MGQLLPTLLWSALVVLAAAVLLFWLARHRRDLGSPAERATFATLHTASLATPPLRGGLTEASAQKAIRHLRALLAAPATALTGADRLLAWDGRSDQHAARALALAEPVLADGSIQVHGTAVVACEDSDCPLKHAIVAPLTVEDRLVGTLQVYTPSTHAGLVRATAEVARWVSGQLELAELDRSRTRLIEAEVRALRAQISPHFIYNSLTAIASFVRTDPERARELLLEFADFTRYSFRRHGDFTTLAEELRSINRYLLLEKARFDERLQITLRVAPEVLPAVVPFLCLQPLVENAVRHGLGNKPGVGHVTILAEDLGNECLISVEDDGVGEDPEKIRRMLAGDDTSDSIGLGNVDERLRTVFGDDYGLVVETAPGAGTKVSMRVPKYRPGVRV
ncbi:MAG: sensor histidine kinase [Micromonosporaceae bacterium]|nr:sensor histidine kinase [Micromonosporaceae bacterium]